MSLVNRDYREFEKTFVSFLDTTGNDSSEKNIKCISTSIEQSKSVSESKQYIKEYVRNSICNENLSVSNTYYRKFCYVVDSFNNKNDILKYLYNIYLCGIGLSTSTRRK